MNTTRKNILSSIEKYLDLDSNLKHVKSENDIYLLEMFMYTSGNIHIGHIRVFSACDLIYKFFVSQGKNVFRPVGWDAFGLPAELASIKNNIDPKTWTLRNIQEMTKTLVNYKFKQNWKTEINTSDFSYYKYDQYIFFLLYKNNLVFQDEKETNLCPNCGVLSNEQSRNDICWRCASKVEKKMTKQWFIRITKYAEDLYNGLEELKYLWPKNILSSQRNWIGHKLLSYYVKELNKYILLTEDTKFVNICHYKYTFLTLIKHEKEKVVKIDSKLVHSKLFDRDPGDEFKINLHDWCISRQRKWGTPLPIIECKTCGTYCSDKFNEFKIENSLDIKCHQCHNWAKRSPDTMDTFMSSSWYMWRFLDNKNINIFPKIKKPVDIYIGGAEHANMHLLYSRFLTRFFFDINLSEIKEPFSNLINQGMVLSKSYFCHFCNIFLSKDEIKENKCKICGNIVEKKIEKMSKSKKNGLSANDLLHKYSVDTIKTYILSKSALTYDIVWEERDIEGVQSFLYHVYMWLKEVKLSEKNKLIDLSYILDSEIYLWNKIRITIENKQMKFNTCFSYLISLFKKIKNINNFHIEQKEVKIFLILLSFYAEGVSNYFSELIYRKSIWNLYKDIPTKLFDNKYKKKINVFLKDKFFFSINILETDKEENILDKLKTHPTFISFLSGKSYKIVFFSKKVIKIE